MTLNLIKDTHRIDTHTAEKIVQFGQMRLRESGVDELGISQEGGTCKETPIVRHQDVEVGELLGKGSFSAAYEVKSICNKPTDHLVLKVLQPKLTKKPALFAGCASDLVREGLLLSQLNHPNVLSCRATSPDGVEAYLNGRHDAFFLVLERLEETVKEKLNRWRKQVPTKKPSFFMWLGGHRRQQQNTMMERTGMICALAEGLQYLHSERILHRDLKPDNLGVDAVGCLKVFDLDVCRILPEEAQQDPSMTFRFTNRIGSPRYMAPEVARGEPYNAKSDVYSFGLLCWELLSLKKPYSEMPSEQHEARVFQGGERPECPNNWPSAVQSLLKRCWTDNLDDRPTMNEVTGPLREDLNRMCSASAVRNTSKLRLYSQESRTQRTNVDSLFSESRNSFLQPPCMTTFCISRTHC